MAALLLACSPAQEDPSSGPAASEEEGRLTLYTVNYPLKYLAERIGGEIVTAVFPAPPGIDPAYWSPEPEQVAAYQGADLILLNGAGYAAWVDRASFLRRQLIDTSAGFRDRLLPLDQAPLHTHGPEGDHSHSGTAFTTWLDPTLALEHARVIADALAGLRTGPSRCLRAESSGARGGSRAPRSTPRTGRAAPRPIAPRLFSPGLRLPRAALSTERPVAALGAGPSARHRCCGRSSHRCSKPIPPS